MSATLWLGLLLQVSAVLLLIALFRTSVVRQIGFYFLVGAFVYHGLTEIWQHATGTYSRTRSVTSTASIDRWTVLAGLAMLMFAVAYSAAVLPARHRQTVDTEPGVDRVVAVLDWRILTLLCLPLLGVVGTSAFRLGDQTGLTSASPSTAAGLAEQFLIIALALAAISCIAQHPKAFLPAVLIQLAATSIIGSRGAIITAAATTLFGLMLLKRLPSIRQMAVGLATVILLTVSIGAIRTQIGRTEFTQAGVTKRVRLIASGAVGAIEGRPGQRQDQLQPFGERIDGNSFAAGILDGQKAQRSSVGLVTVKNDLALAVPSFINPAKLSSNLASRSEKVYIAGHFSILFGEDFLPTQFGTMLAYYGRGGLLALAFLLGGAMGLAERVFRRRATPSRLILTLALFTCAVSYEQPMEIYPLEFRGALAVVIVVFVIDHARQALRKNRRPVQLPPPTVARPRQKASAR